jgi:hypothetical protein
MIQTGITVTSTIENRRKIKRLRLGPVEYAQLLKTLKTMERQQLKNVYVEILKILMGGSKKKGETDASI